MPGEAHIMLHLEEAAGAGDDQRILLRLDVAGLERVVEPVDVDGDGLRAERAEGVEEELALRRPDLEAGEIGEDANGFPRRGDVAKTVLEAAPRHQPDALGDALPLQMLAEIAVERAIDLGRAAKGEGY